MMKRIQVYPILQTIASSDPDFNIVYDLPTGESVDVVKPEYLSAYFLNFADWYLLKPDNDERTDEEYLRYIWIEYCNMQSPNWNMLFKALFSEYDPLDNYDITETSNKTYTTGDKVFTHTPNGATDTAVVETADDTTTPPKTSHYVATYASAEKPQEYTKTEGKTTTTTNTTIRSTYSDLTEKANDLESSTLHRHGNAGVMTTSEVIRQEALLRKSELAAEIVMGGFVDKYLFYSGGIEL